MTTQNTPDRPTLKRGPRAAADSDQDPILPAAAPATTPTTAASTPATEPRPRRRTREATIPLSTQVSVEVREILDDVTAEGHTLRSAVEEAIKHHWGNRR